MVVVDGEVEDGEAVEVEGAGDEEKAEVKEEAASCCNIPRHSATCAESMPSIGSQRRHVGG